MDGLYRYRSTEVVLPFAERCKGGDLVVGLGCFGAVCGQAMPPSGGRKRFPLYLMSMETDSNGPPKSTLTEILFVVFLRMVAIACFRFGMQYWAMLVGYAGGGVARFDLLPAAWRAAGVSLAVVFPVAALGLWLAVSWGPVIWACAALGQVLMYTVWKDVYGDNILVPAMHAFILVVYTLFRIALFLERREKVVRVSSGLP